MPGDWLKFTGDAERADGATGRKQEQKQELMLACLVIMMIVEKPLECSNIDD